MRRIRRGPVVTIAVWGAAVAMVSPAAADHKVYSPYVEEGVLEFEARGHRTYDHKSDNNNQWTHIYEIAYGVNSWWYTSLIGVVDKQPHEGFRYAATGWENIFQLTPQGKYWADVGLYLEYRKSHIPAEPGEVETKLLLEKDVDPLVLTANLIFNRATGRNAGKGIGFEYALRAKYPWKREIQFAVEAFGEPGRLTGFEAIAEQQHQIGPVILGKFNLDGVPGVFNYNLGYLTGLTRGTPKSTLKWEFEYEIPF
jgi:hypothetical protein